MQIAKSVAVSVAKSAAINSTLSGKMLAKVESQLRSFTSLREEMEDQGETALAFAMEGLLQGLGEVHFNLLPLWRQESLKGKSLPETLAQVNSVKVERFDRRSTHPLAKALSQQVEAWGDLALRFFDSGYARLGTAMASLADATDLVVKAFQAMWAKEVAEIRHMAVRPEPPRSKRAIRPRHTYTGSASIGILGDGSVFRTPGFGLR